MTSTVRLAFVLCALSLWLACGSTQSSPPPSSPASAAPAAVPEPSRAERHALHGKGMAAYDHKDYATCASLLELARDFYSAACCYALAGDRDHAFASLSRAIDGGWRNPAFEKDADLVPLHDDPRWPKELAHFQAKAAEHNRSLNSELTRLYDEDQADRAVSAYEQIDWSKVGPRDQTRRKRVDEIVAAGGARAADDYYHAAMVYQHGDSPDEIQRAHDLAIKAVELDPRHDAARWLAAASEDRKLMYEKKPQKWGTQYQKVDGKWVLWQVDPATTDEQRDEWNVPPLAEARAQADRMNAPK